MGRGNNASWPVGGATRQSGGNWVGRFEKPEDWSIWASMYSSYLELGQLITVGDSILKWTAAGVRFVDAVFATQADLDSFCSKLGATIAPGSTATVAGVAKTWDGTGWASATNILPAYETWGEAVTAARTTKGWVGLVRRLCGNGYFHVMHNGSRLGVQCGESIIRDAGPGSVGYDLTATGTAYVALASYTIPAGMIGDGEEWEVDNHSRNLGVYSIASNTQKMRIGGVLIGTNSALLTAINVVSRVRGVIVRLGTTVINRAGGTATSDLYSSAGLTDSALDLSSDQSIDCGFVPGAAANTMQLRQWVLRRIG